MGRRAAPRIGSPRRRPRRRGSPMPAKWAVRSLRGTRAAPGIVWRLCGGGLVARPVAVLLAGGALSLGRSSPAAKAVSGCPARSDGIPDDRVLIASSCSEAGGILDAPVSSASSDTGCPCLVTPPWRPSASADPSTRTVASTVSSTSHSASTPMSASLCVSSGPVRRDCPFFSRQPDSPAFVVRIVLK